MRRIKPGGVPTTYSQEIMDKTYDYIDNFDTKYNQAIPSVAGLSRVIGKCRYTIYQWARHEEKEMKDALEALSAKQEEILLTKGLTNDFNPSVTKMCLTRHGYTDRVKNELSGVDGNPIEVDQTWTVNVVGVGDT